MTMSSKKKHVWSFLAAVMLCVGFSQSAWAGRGFQGHGGFHGHGRFQGHGRFHSNFGFFIGAPLFWWPPDPFFYPPYYYPSYYYPPISQVYVEQTPVYVQRNDTAANPPAANYWYYCQNPQGYYPYVQDCPAGWMKVVPQPPQ